MPNEAKRATKAEREAWRQWNRTLTQVLADLWDGIAENGDPVELTVVDNPVVVYGRDGCTIGYAGHRVRIPYGTTRRGILSAVGDLFHEARNAAIRGRQLAQAMYQRPDPPDEATDADAEAAGRPATISALRAGMLNRLYDGASPEDLVESLWSLLGVPPEATCPDCMAEAMAATH